MKVNDTVISEEAEGSLPAPLSSIQSNLNDFSFRLFLNSDYLDEISTKLNSEDPSTRPLRRALGFMDILNKAIICSSLNQL